MQAYKFTSWIIITFLFCFPIYFNFLVFVIQWIFNSRRQHYLYYVHLHTVEHEHLYLLIFHNQIFNEEQKLQGKNLHCTARLCNELYYFLRKIKWHDQCLCLYSWFLWNEKRRANVQFLWKIKIICFLLVQISRSALILFAGTFLTFLINYFKNNVCRRKYA